MPEGYEAKLNPGAGAAVEYQTLSFEAISIPEMRLSYKRYMHN
jgi:hypothetical protein